MKVIGYIVMTILIIVYGLSLNSWVLMNLWSWFVVPLFSVQPLTMMTAMGLWLVVIFLTNRDNPLNKKKDELSYDKKMIYMFSWTTSRALATLAAGAIIKALV